MALKMPEDYHPFAGPQWQEMTVSQIEVLAKAGVKVELQCPVRVISDPPTPYPQAVHQFGTPDHLLELVSQRWEMAMRAKYASEEFNRPTFFETPLVSACKHGETVYIFVRGGKGTPPHVIEDPMNIFPSDALLAKLHLLMEFGK